MLCHCSCHDLELFSLTNKYVSPYMTGPCCSSCALPSEPEYKATYKNLEAFVTEVQVTEDYPNAALRYEFRVKAPNPLESFGVVVMVSQSLHSAQYMDAKAQVYSKAAAHFNEHFAKQGGMPDWIKARIKAWVLGHPAVGKGGHAITFQPTDLVSGNTVKTSLATQVPGLYERVVCPEILDDLVTYNADGTTTLTKASGGPRCTETRPVMDMVVHLNDGHRWTREKIADWLETLDVDLSFPSEIREPQPRRRQKPSLPFADPKRVLFILAPTFTMAKHEAYLRKRPTNLWRYVSTDPNRVSDANEMLRGHQHLQCVVLGDEPVHPHLGQLLGSIGAREVGDDASVSQTADLMQWQSSDGTVLASIPAPPPLTLTAAQLKMLEAQFEQYLPKPKKEIEGAWKPQAEAHLETLNELLNAASKHYLNAIHPLDWKNEHVHHVEPILDKKQYALDQKKHSAHTHFTVNPTKKSPFKK